MGNVPNRADDELILSALEMRAQGMTFDEIAAGFPERTKNSWIGIINRCLKESDRHEIDALAVRPVKHRGMLTDNERRALEMRRNGCTYKHISKVLPERSGKGWCNFIHRHEERRAA